MVAYFPPDTYELVPRPHYPTGSVPDAALLDTNILIDFLKGRQDAVLVFEDFRDLYVSAISYMEVMVGLDSPEEAVQAASMFSMVKVLPVLHPVEDIAVALRKHAIGQSHVAGAAKLKVPDALIHATALANDLPIVTRDRKGFKVVPESVLQPFGLVANVKVLTPY